ncbi:MAG TPA: redoxin domain-containing protein [Oligoflexia bacterium]|nr:redoxin domain-containing protein [Oligoflexia bacterium]HMP26437.1 redoxin domain-containing protein [Oligoflexia bacterium]
MANLPDWSVKFLRVVAVYYFLLGATAFLLPESWFFAAGIKPADPQQAALLLQVAGTPLFAVAFVVLLASFAVRQTWPVLILGLIYNGLDFFVTFHFIRMGRISLVSGLVFMLIALFLTVGFAVLLYRVYRFYASDQKAWQESFIKDALSLKPDGSQLSLAELSETTPLVLIMIRHVGCTFCRETLDRLARELKNFSGDAPLKIVVVGLSSVDSIRALLTEYGLSDLLVLSDPDQIVYRAFEIKRGGFWQLFGARELWSGIVRGGLFKYGLGGVEGDPFQLPGSALIDRGRVVKTVSARSAADYCGLERVYPAI